MTQRVAPIKTKVFHQSEFQFKEDLLAVEEPLEIRLGFGPSAERQQKSLAITMRTPGNDENLVVGFLFTENIISSLDQISYIDYCKDDNGEKSENVIRVELNENIKLVWEDLQRNFFTNSSCGICGKASIENLEKVCPTKLEYGFNIASKIIHSLEAKMRNAQSVFEHTGGLHAAALYNKEGKIEILREDVGRHNALDKLIGEGLIRKIDFEKSIVLLSGRASFELIQKSLMAGIPIIAAIGAPSSLAAETAETFNLTLCGFTRNSQFNIYSGSQRIS